MIVAICEDDIVYINGLKYSCEGWAKRHPDSGLVIRQYNNPEDFLYDWECGDRFDILFLDIMFPHMNGAELAKKIRETDKESMIVFVTNSRQYAIGGYMLNIHRYLLKPASDQAISECLDDCYQHYFVRREYITFSDADGGKRFAVNDLIKIETRGHILELTFCGEKVENIRIYEPLDKIMKRLPQRWFLRVNRSTIINMLYVQKFNHKQILVLNSKMLVNIGSVYKKEVYQKLTDYFWGNK